MKKFDLIYADPPWRYSFSKSKSRQVENQYSTMTVDDIAALKIPTKKNAVLFLWATAPKLLEALYVMDRWGFTYKTHAVWDKIRVGMGYWFRGQHELLLVGTKGKFSPPPPSLRTSSVITTLRQEHSRKPDYIRTLLTRQFPTAVKLELFARQKTPGWHVWGNEV